MTARAGWFLLAVAFPTLVHGQWISFAALAPTQLSLPGFATEGTGKGSVIGDDRNDFCLINGPGDAQCGAQVNFIATSPFLAGQTFNATWSLLNNNAGASFVGPNTCTQRQSCQVIVTTSSPGSVIVRVILDFGGGVLKTCQMTLTVAGGGPPTGTCPPDIVVPCPGPIDPSVTGTPTFSNTCGQITTTFIDTVTGSNCAGSIITRTWTATNAQGQIGNLHPDHLAIQRAVDHVPGPRHRPVLLAGAAAGHRLRDRHRQLRRPGDRDARGRRGLERHVQLPQLHHPDVPGDERVRHPGELHADDHGERHHAAHDHLPRPR